MIPLEDIKWTPINRETLRSMRSNPELHKLLRSLSPSMQYHTTKNEVYLRRPDGRITVHPKRNGEPYCGQCMKTLGHASPVTFATKVDSDGKPKEDRLPYCVNEDNPDTI